MGIPALVDGVLPDGIHDCTLDEIAAVFGQTPHRARLMANLRDYVGDAVRSGLVAAVIVDGSFVTAKRFPGDIDLIVVQHTRIEPWRTPTPAEYRPVTKPLIRDDYGFDAFPVMAGSAKYDTWVGFFIRVNRRKLGFTTSRTTKGLLRVTL